MAVTMSMKVFGFAAAIFTALAVSTSLILIIAHIRYYTLPNHQRYIIRILSMVPVYAIYSCLSIFFYNYHVYFALLRDSYEAYIMYQFFVLCTNYGGGFDNLAARIAAQPPIPLAWPFQCVRAQPGHGFLVWCRRGVLQYVFVKPICALIAMVLQIEHRYEDGVIRSNRGFLYIAIVVNISVTIALYCLVFFYQATHEELKPYRPLLKFICIKFVVFFSYWQGIVIVLLVQVGLIPTLKNGWSSGELAAAIQNFLICIEMFIVALMHIKAFPYDMYRVKVMSQAPLMHQIEMGSWLKAAKDSANQHDLLSDTYDSFVPDTLKNSSTKSKSGHIRLQEIESLDENAVHHPSHAAAGISLNSSSINSPARSHDQQQKDIISKKQSAEESHFVNQNLERTLSEDDDSSSGSNRR